MMQDVQQTNISLVAADTSLSAKQLRLWSAPEVILIVTNFTDEQPLLLEAMQQAKHSHAKILLAYVARPSCSRKAGLHGPRLGRPQSVAHDAQLMLERMARQLRWAGIASEPVLLQGLPAEEIPDLVRLRGVNRVIVTTQSDSRATGLGSRAIAEQILPRVTVPVCIVGGGHAAHPQLAAPYSSILLGLSPRMRTEVLLEFASHLARMHRAALTVLYTAESPVSADQPCSAPSGGGPKTDPLWVVQKAKSRFGFETILANGDLIGESLAAQRSRKQDLIVLGTEPSDLTEWSDTVSCPVLVAKDAPCPVLILGNAVGKQRYDEPVRDAEAGIDKEPGRSPMRPLPLERDLVPMFVPGTEASRERPRQMETA